MAFIEFNINLQRTAEALERIADVLERAFPLAEYRPTEKLRDRDSLVRVRPETLWEKQREQKIERAKREGIPLDEA